MDILCIWSHLFNISKTLIQVINANLVSISNRFTENKYIKVDKRDQAGSFIDEQKEINPFLKLLLFEI